MAHSSSSTAVPAVAGARSGPLAAWRPALLAALLGVLILYGIGFAQPLAIHDAAHDARHAFAFPCH